jgi:hypothetical protein
MRPFRITASGQSLKIYGKSFINILNRLGLKNISLPNMLANLEIKLS